MTQNEVLKGGSLKHPMELLLARQAIRNSLSKLGDENTNPLIRTLINELIIKIENIIETL